MTSKPFVIVGAVAAWLTVVAAHAQPARPATSGKALLALVVSPTSCSVARQNGQCQFVIGAATGGGFSGQVTGNLTVSPPTALGNISLSAGTAPLEVNFSLSAIQQTPGACPPSKTGAVYCFTIRTSPNNTGSGTLFWGVTLTPISPNAFVPLDPPPSQTITVTIN